MNRRRLWPEEDGTELVVQFGGAFDSKIRNDIVDSYGLLRIPPSGIARSPWIRSAEALGTDVLAAIDPEEWRRVWRQWKASGGLGVVVMPPWEGEWSAENEKELLDRFALPPERLRSRIDEFLDRRKGVPRIRRLSGRR